jgi:glycosyltransferase involved in cell wall biosynthesis
MAGPHVVPAETWFMECSPTGDELVSIIILCCNQIAYSRQCLDSVLKHTRSPYELVIVDNGSTDETAGYLEELKNRAPTAGHRVEVITNQENVGFAAGCNQALKRCRGQYVVFLNNDTIVTEGWLEGLVAWSLYDWPKNGLVGPMSNYAPDPQRVIVPYEGTEGIDAYAALRRHEFGGKALGVQRLTGFCLLARRGVLERIGGFDEQYALGFFEDDDLCVRARQAGFHLFVASDVFIHHFGSRTFAGLGIDCTEQLNANLERFRAKWGEGLAGCYDMPGWGENNHKGHEEHKEEFLAEAAEGAERKANATTDGTVERPATTSDSHPAVLTTDYWLLTTPRVGISCCLIVKNEESNLGECLSCVRDLVDEIVVVDTGSVDRTKEIALTFGARVFDFVWVDSFAAARNEGLKHATGEWIFWMDADDRIDEENRRKLRKLLDDLRGSMGSKEEFLAEAAENAEQNPNCCGRSPDRATEPTDRSRDANKETLRSSGTAGSGDPRRAQPVGAFSGVPSTAPYDSSLRSLRPLRETSLDAFVMVCRCLPNRETGTTTEVHHVRLFRNDPRIRWEFRVHEQILGSVRRAGGTPRFTDIVICHTGYQDAELRRRKSERDLRLLLMEYAEQPDHRLRCSISDRVI